MLLSFAGRLGQVVIAPRAALARIDREGGGFRDALILVVLGTICLRFPQLAEALLGLMQPSQGTLLRVVGVFSNEARDAAMVIIPATLAITILAGRRRDANLDLELGAACFTPFFVARAIERVAFAVIAHPGRAGVSSGLAYAPAIAWAGWVLVQALRVTWSRPLPGAKPAVDAASAEARAEVDPAVRVVTPPTESRAAAGELVPPVTTVAAGSAPAPRARTVGFAALAVLIGGLGINVAWASRHFDALRPMEHGEPAPEVDLPRIDGTDGRLSLGSLRGKVVLLDFWATWCPPCIQMIPILHDLHAEWAARGVEFVGVDSDGPQSTVEEIRAFLRSHPAPYPIVLDDGSANTSYKIRALPQMVLIDREGAVRKVFIGYTSRRDLAAAFASVVGAPTAEH